MIPISPPSNRQGRFLLSAFFPLPPAGYFYVITANFEICVPKAVDGSRRIKIGVNLWDEFAKKMGVFTVQQEPANWYFAFERE
jgi:hypothetical protein